MSVVPYWCLDTLLLDARIFYSGIFRHQATHLFEYFGGCPVCPEGGLRAAKFLFDANGKIADNLPIGTCLPAWFESLAHALNPAVRVGKCAFFLGPGCRRQKYIGIRAGLVDE